MKTRIELHEIAQRIVNLRWSAANAPAPRLNTFDRYAVEQYRRELPGQHRGKPKPATETIQQKAQRAEGALLFVLLLRSNLHPV